MREAHPGASFDQSSLEFGCMGTEMRITVVHGVHDKHRAGQALARMEAFFREAERRFSRFRDDSELSELNRTGHLVRPSADFIEVMGRAVRWRQLTNGVFNPSVLPSLEEAGYDCDFASVSARSRRGRIGASPLDPDDCLITLTTDEEGRTRVDLEPGARVDLGGIVKGWAADRDSEHLREFAGTLVDSGGDISAHGRRPDGHPWIAGVADPDHPDELIDAIAMESGGLATSNIRKRSWDDGVGRAHHIIDPMLGAPARSGVVQATVFAHSTEAADVLAKCVVVIGPERGLQLVESFAGARALLVLEPGSPKIRQSGSPGTTGTGEILESKGWASLRPANPIPIELSV
ncbi:MAG: FAD:protein FMN transferase [Chloroflexi bacterium]|nr:FAD:protein FMN transferase [Chloroflexota bacterium]